jgi:hypothetical protein
LRSKKQKRHNAAGETVRGIIAANLSKAGWSLGWISAVDSGGRTIWIVDAHRDNGKRFVARANKKLDRIIGLEFLRSQNPFDTVELRVLVLGGMPNGSGQTNR